jgi:hypothetical protein
MSDTDLNCSQCGGSKKCQADANPGNGKHKLCLGTGQYPIGTPCPSCDPYPGDCPICKGTGVCQICK